MFQFSHHWINQPSVVGEERHSIVVWMGYFLRLVLHFDCELETVVIRITSASNIDTVTA